MCRYRGMPLYLYNPGVMWRHIAQRTDQLRFQRVEVCLYAFTRAAIDCRYNGTRLCLHTRLPSDSIEAHGVPV